MAEDLGNKTEDPTAKRLSDAREKGQIAKSIDLSGALDMIGAAALIWLFGTTVVAGLSEVMRGLLADNAPSGWLDAESAPLLFGWALARGFAVVWPMMAIMFGLVLAIQLQQVGFLFTTKPLEPKVDKLNPFTGFGKLFNTKSAVKTLLNTVKLAGVSAVVFAFTSVHMHEIARLPRLELPAAQKMIFVLLLELMCWLLAAMLVIGVADYFYQLFQHKKDLKMTKQEVKDEHKTSEGDLEMRARRQRMGREMITQQLKSAVPKADVIVTNPTHYAVALRYDPATGAAPVVLAKGADYVALRIREIAAANGVPIMEKPALARALYNSVPVGREVPTQFYEAVAELLAFVYRIAGKAEQARAKAQTVLEESAEGDAEPAANSR